MRPFPDLGWAFRTASFPLRQSLEGLLRVTGGMCDQSDRPEPSSDLDISSEPSPASPPAGRPLW